MVPTVDQEVFAVKGFCQFLKYKMTKHAIVSHMLRTLYNYNTVAGRVANIESKISTKIRQYDDFPIQSLYPEELVL